MKIKGYSAFTLDDATRAMVLERFPPIYPVQRATHVTEQFGAEENASFPPRAAKISLIGIADDGIGSQALLAKVDGIAINPFNGKPYHLTISYDPSKKLPVQAASPGRQREEFYSSSYSGAMLAQGKVPVTPIEPPLEIIGTLRHIDRNAELRPRQK